MESRKIGTDKIRSLIIDDDPFILQLLQDKIQQYVPVVEMLATANSGTEGLEAIKRFQPDLVFLDVEMLDMTGFEMLAQLDNIEFQTIFITSYTHYAIKAIRFNALDYLVKPIDLGELKNALKRYEKRPNHENVKVALQNFQTSNVSDQVLILQTQVGELKMALKNIIRIEGERNYSYVYLKNDKRRLVSKILAEMETLLEGKGFFRCHRSFLVNFSSINTVKHGSTLIMSDGVEIPISRRKKDLFLSWYQTKADTPGND